MEYTLIWYNLKAAKCKVQLCWSKKENVISRRMYTKYWRNLTIFLFVFMFTQYTRVATIYNISFQQNYKTTEQWKRMQGNSLLVRNLGYRHHSCSQIGRKYRTFIVRCSFSSNSGDTTAYMHISTTVQFTWLNKLYKITWINQRMNCYSCSVRTVNLSYWEKNVPCSYGVCIWGTCRWR